MYDPTQNSDPLRPPTDAENLMINWINTAPDWSRERALTELKAHLQVAVEVELATLPIYLYTYYSINRTPDGFPTTPVTRFADEAGAMIMSVAVEEMLHMSLSANILNSLGQDPVLYKKSPWPYPTNLPGHDLLGPDAQELQLPLAPFSLEQMWKFLEIEYPASADAPPQGGDWDTIGQVYSYIRCVILSKYITDDDFKNGAADTQIQTTNYSPNNIDTVFPTDSFNKKCPVSTSAAGSAASVADFTSRNDSHAGAVELMTIQSRNDALLAIQTIDAQGEGYDFSKYDDPSDQEFSHYYKFLKLQSNLEGYDPSHEKIPQQNPTPPAAATSPITNADLQNIVYPVPTNPVAANYPTGYKECADVVNGLYQYMLIMTETIFKVPAAQQKLYFNQALHRSMIWILDKVIQAMRNQTVTLTSGETVAFAPSFENIDLGTRAEAFGTLKSKVTALNNQLKTESWYTDDIQGYINMIPSLFDVSPYWTPGIVPADVLDANVAAAKAATSAIVPDHSCSAPTPHCDISAYTSAQVPHFPSNPPAQVNPGEVRHACMGLNSCAGQGRTRDNSCAGQGYCSTALAYNYADPGNPLAADHTCHVKNNCAGQGGCGLYGTADEQSGTEPGHGPGANDCATKGSCATPINAERFSTMGENQKQSVWVRAREIFETQTYPALRQTNPHLPETPPSVPHPDLFGNGPTIQWIRDYSRESMTACGASGMSGAGSCS